MSAEVWVLRVYPRVCGGTAFVFLTGVLFPGLSPRVRGNRFQGQPRHPWAGSIPACAGEPCCDARIA